jgi:hypothetical protein
MHKTRLVPAFALAFALAAAGAAALEPADFLRANFGVLIESHLNPDFESNVASPSINFNFGAGLNYPFSAESPLSFAPSALFYSYYGEYIEGQPVSADQAFSSTYILGLMLNSAIMYTTPIGKSEFTFSGGVGLCIDARIALKSGDIPEDPERNTASADDAAAYSNKYFWEKGRFIVPSTTINIDYALTERIGVGMTTRILWPFYNLWTKEGYGFLDQTKYVINLTLRYNLKSKGPEEAAAEAAADSEAPPEAEAAQASADNAAPVEAAPAAPPASDAAPKPEGSGKTN